MVEAEDSKEAARSLVAELSNELKLSYQMVPYLRSNSNIQVMQQKGELHDIRKQLEHLKAHVCANFLLVLTILRVLKSHYHKIKKTCATLIYRISSSLTHPKVNLKDTQLHLPRQVYSRHTNAVALGRVWVNLTCLSQSAQSHTCLWKTTR